MTKRRTRTSSESPQKPVNPSDTVKQLQRIATKREAQPDTVEGIVGTNAALRAALDYIESQVRTTATTFHVQTTDVLAELERRTCSRTNNS